MTTLVVVRKGNMAAIAADSLTTFGDTRLSVSFDASSEKMVRYGDTVIALCGSAVNFTTAPSGNVPGLIASSRSPAEMSPPSGPIATLPSALR